MRPTEPGADYRVRIFTPYGELPFAGHPTLGSAWAWLDAGGTPTEPGVVAQQCGVRLVRVRRSTVEGRERLAFAATPLRRTGPLDEPLLARVCGALRVPVSEVLRHQWVDNGPGWMAVQLASAQAVRAVTPDRAALGDLKIGIIGAHAAAPDRYSVSQGHALGRDGRVYLQRLGGQVWVGGDATVPLSHPGKTMKGHDGL